jgi:hypothetical protein
MRRSKLRLRLFGAGLAVVAALSLSACKEVEEESAAGYEPAKLEPIKGSKDDEAKRIVFTKEGAQRVDLKTARVRANGDGGGDQTVIPYAALIYNDEAKTFVYTSDKPLSFERVPVKVDRIDEDRVLLSEGPRAGTEVVTTGATEVYGTELEIAASH